MKKVYFAAALAVMAASFSYAQPVKIAVVDLQRILSESIRGKEAKSILEKEMEKKKEIIESKRKEVEDLIAEYEKQKLVLSEKALQKKRELIDTKTRELQEMILNYQQELQKKDQELTRSIINEVSGIVEAIAKREGYTLVLEKNEGGVIFNVNWIDITDRVLKEYDTRVKRKKK